jgi:hypothetical protein
VVFRQIECGSQRAQLCWFVHLHQPYLILSTTDFLAKQFTVNPKLSESCASITQIKIHMLFQFVQEIHVILISVNDTNWFLSSVIVSRISPRLQSLSTITVYPLPTKEKRMCINEHKQTRTAKASYWIIIIFNSWELLS